MSETSSAVNGVSLNKPSRWAAPSVNGTGKRPPKPPAAIVKPPLMINLVTAALIVMVLGNVARAVLLLGHTPVLRTYVVAQNKKAKHPNKSLNVEHAVHVLRQGAMFQALIFGLALVMLAYAMRRSRSASGTRWAVLVIFVYTAMPFYIIPTKGLPVAVQTSGVIIGIAAVATILLIFVPPQSQAYFRQCRTANMPEGKQGQARPGLSSLFKPKPRGAGGGGGLFGGGRAAAANRPAQTRPATTRPTAPKAKAKVRNDSDAIAKGAELARSRAKASKSRRTPE